MYFDRIKRAFSSVLDTDASESITSLSKMEDVNGWDSLNFIALVVAIEHEFNVQLTTLDAASLTSIPAIEKYLLEKLE